MAPWQRADGVADESDKSFWNMGTDEDRRGVLYFTISEIEPRVWITLTGCNFRCRGCFSAARVAGGVVMSAEETLEKLEIACTKHCGFVPKELLITGGEPTISKRYLLNLITLSSEMGFKNIVLCTNGYGIGVDATYGEDLKAAGLSEAQLDIKAYDSQLHLWYTGKSNAPVLRAAKNMIDAGIDLIVQTVHIPGIVEEDEIRKIASFLAGINPEIRYRINQFEPRFSHEDIARSPTEEEVTAAYEAAFKHLPNTIVSMSCRRDFTKEPRRGKWITVYPDLSFKRRGVIEYARERLRTVY